MNWFGVTFVVFPCLGAVAVGWGIRHWALAAATATGALAVLALTSAVPFGQLRVVIPFVTGAGIAGLALAGLLLIRPEATVWSRLIAALTTAFAAHFLYLHFALAGR